ncbi:phenylacetate--CoA ligase family protein [Clostridium perfringens]|nr:phenylacetate--CoA ligase family protein [Clostridium perfringens]
MKFDVLLRKMGFWFIDFLKGGKIKKYYDEINDFYYNGADEKLIRKNIMELLNHAKETTKFYSNYKYVDSIEEFPVMNKIMYTEHYDEFISNKFNTSKLHKMSTSGSTGTPFTVMQDKNKRKRVLAELCFYGKVCGYELGMRQLYFRVWTDSVRKNKIQAFKQNLVMSDISNLNKDNLESIKNMLIKDKKIRNILSYASTLDILSDYLDNGEVYNFNIESIISSSEILHNKTREKLKKIFNCNVVSRYSNQENGILAQECIERQEFNLNTSSYYFELLKLDKDEPAEYGEIGRIVITDLYNYAMPIIRYDTGDTGIIEKRKINGKDKLILKELFGRRVDIIYDTKGNILSPHIITNNMWGVEGIKQFKFTQEEKRKYRVTINAQEDKNISNCIIDKFKFLLGEDATIQIDYVDEIPVLASGKRKYIENMIK